MNRFFAKKEGNAFLLSDDSLFHLRSVLRMKVGERIELVSEGTLHEATIASLDPFSLVDIEEKEEKRESDISLALAFSLLKGAHDELVIQKGTELGVKEFFPLLSERTIIQLPKEADRLKRKERFAKIAFGAAEQSKRLTLPIVHDIMSYQNALEGADYDHKLIAYEGEAMGSSSLYKELKSIKKGDKAIVFVGPEGGWSEEEVKEAKKSGYKAVSLGRRILRAETASIYVASLFAAIGDE